MLTDAKSRYDITHSTGTYPFFESLLINKIKFNIGGLSFNYAPRPFKFKGNEKRLAEMIIGKGSSSISSLFVPNLSKNYIAYGDVKTTNDAMIIFFDESNKTIEIFIARGLKNDKQQLYTEVSGGYLDLEMEAIRKKATFVFKGELPNQ
ncbi:MAG: hypothetical protein IPO70_04395 [Bacteroidetes bacterium]|nr:hypothetical protein [Bacteroidota bacterium]